MKYKPWQNPSDQKFYVANSSRSSFFWRDTMSDTLKECIEKCIKMEERYLIDQVTKYERKSRKAFAKLEKMFPNKYGGAGGCNYGDLVC